MTKIIEFFGTALGIQLITILIALIVISILAAVVKRVIPRYIVSKDSTYKVMKFTNFIGYVLFIVTILVVFSNQLTGLTVFLGVGGAGIAFALQEVIASVAGFIVIHTSNFYKVGDRVMVGGIKGDVIDIGLLRTSVMEIGDWVNGDLYNGRITSVTNSFVFKEPVHNYSGEFPFLWDEMKVPIKTNSDFEYAQTVLTTILNKVESKYAKNAQSDWDEMTKKFMIENARVAPLVTMAFDENWITFTLRYVVDHKSRRGTKDSLSREILTAINNSDGRLEVASAAFEITAFPNRKM